MIQQVKKRDGRMVAFNPLKIVNAISKAGFVTDDVKSTIATEIHGESLDGIRLQRRGKRIRKIQV